MSKTCSKHGTCHAKFFITSLDTRKEIEDQKYVWSILLA